MNLPPSVRAQLTLLLEQTADATGVPTATIRGRSRQAGHVQARFAFIWTASHHAATRHQVATFLGRDRTTILHATATVSDLLKASPEGPFSQLIQDLSHDATQRHCPTNQSIPLATTMTVRTAPKDHTLDVTIVADAARAFTAQMEGMLAREDVTDLEVMTFLRETAAHCRSHYIDIRSSRRRQGLEADPYNHDRGLEAWIDMDETKAEAPPAPHRTHPPRSQRKSKRTTSAA
jgi:hypothetical protein